VKTDASRRPGLRWSAVDWQTGSLVCLRVCLAPTALNIPSALLEYPTERVEASNSTECCFLGRPSRRNEVLWTKQCGSNGLGSIMKMSADRKTELIHQYQRSEADTGSRKCKSPS